MSLSAHAPSQTLGGRSHRKQHYNREMRAERCVEPWVCDTMIRDGTVVPQEPLTEDTTKRLQQRASELWESGHQGEKSVLVAARANKMAGIGTVNCAACDKVETHKVKFNKCSRCMEVCYCTRRCQVQAIYVCIHCSVRWHSHDVLFILYV